MQSVSSRIWTRVAVSISYDDNHYTTGIVDNIFKRAWAVNGFDYFYLIWIILFTFNHLFSHSWTVSSIAM